MQFDGLPHNGQAKAGAVPEDVPFLNGWSKSGTALGSAPVPSSSTVIDPVGPTVMYTSVPDGYAVLHSQQDCVTPRGRHSHRP